MSSIAQAECRLSHLCPLQSVESLSISLYNAPLNHPFLSMQTLCEPSVTNDDLSWIHPECSQPQPLCSLTQWVHGFGLLSLPRIVLRYKCLGSAAALLKRNLWRLTRGICLQTEILMLKHILNLLRSSIQDDIVMTQTLETHSPQVQIPGWLLTGFVTCNKLFNLSVPQFPPQ